jgi:plastocyanin
MKHVLRATALSILLTPAALLLTGCSGVSGGTDAGGASPRAAAASTTSDATLHVMPSAAQGTTEKGEPNQVVIDNFAFQPRQLTVAAGTRVTFVNRDDVPHTATSTARPRAFDSGTLDTDGRFTHVFTTPGTYEYFCALHPRMTGTIVVK